MATLSNSRKLPLRFSTLVDLLQHRAIHQPDQIGYRFLQDGETEVISLSYQALDREAKKIATQLQSLNLQGKKAILLYSPGLDFIAAFFGCLYASVAAVPAYPPQIQQNLSRLQVMIADVQATVILTTTMLLTEVRNYVAQSPEAHLSIITTDNLTDDLISAWHKPNLSSNSLAFIQYTSGSTGNPKGVMLSHDNLLHNSAFIYQGFEHSTDSRGVIWLPPYHDMGLIGGIIQPLYGGFPVVLMSPVSFLRKPLRWLQAISRDRATTSGGPNFAYNLCLQKITPQQKATLDLSCWEVAFTGAEPISAQILEQFAQAFAPCGFRREAFYSCYGLAEATLFITGGLKTKPPTIQQIDSTALQQNRVVVASDDSLKIQTIVSCGHPLEQKVVIVDPQSLYPLQTGQIGEIWVSGSSVAQGYWNQPEKTQETFFAYLNDTKEGPFLRTGDLGFLQDGELFVTGRIKDVIIIRGQNYYPQDIELTVQSNLALRQGCCAAFSLEIQGEEQLVIVVEIKRESSRKLNSQDVITAIRSAVSKQHGLQTGAILLLKQGTIPKTSSGKIQRHSCKTKFQENSFNPIACWHKASTQLTIPNSYSPSPMSQPHTDDLIQWLRNYANEHINSRLIDERRCIPPYLVLDFGNQGLLGMQVPSEYGGLGLNHTDTMRILEQLGAIDPTLSLFVGLNNILGIRPVLKFGTKALREELLPILATGRELAAFALTESGAGSNPQAIASKAIAKTEGSWLLRGQKIWSGSAAWAGAINVFVQDLDKDGKSRGISGFVIRKGSKGLRQGPESLTMGMRGMVQNTLYLDDVLVNSQQRLGEPGAGIKVAQDAMMYGRLAIAAACVGGMKRCVQLMLRYSERRTISTGRLLDNPLTLTRINGLTAAITAVEVLVKTIAKLLDSGVFVPVEAYTACKIAAPEFYWQAADDLVQCLGGRGYIETNMAPQILRDARILRIFEGPTETLNMFLGSRVINQSELKQFLCHSLETPDVYQRLITDAQAIQDYYTSPHSPFSEALTAKRWTSIIIGEIATFAILLAALKQTAYQSDSESLDRAIAWTKQHLEQKLTLALSRKPDEIVVSSAQKTADIINNYQTSIGDLEQTLAGEDGELDELLRKSPVKVAAQRLLETSQPVSTTKSLEVSILETDIQNWLLDWLGKKLKISPQLLDPFQSFADYGLDSVIAVELAQDLQEWLAYPQELDATIAWNFPTIKSLAQHLSQLLKSAESQFNSEQISNSIEQKMISQIQEFSEAQLQDSITQEMAELENLLQAR